LALPNPGHPISGISDIYPTQQPPEAESRRKSMESPSTVHVSEASTHALHTLSEQIALALVADPAAALPEIREHVQARLFDCMPQSLTG
jgi:hypothetical protein